jgi:uncharacterized protein YgbK (DUF1537 family)
MSRPVLRLIADDLTGALDTAAEFAALAGPVPVRWDGAAQPGSLALASNTREVPREDATARVAALAAGLHGADIAFKKLDSLMRGHVAAEIAACLRGGAFRSVVLAPAFPAQGRITRGGRQFALRDGTWQEVADIAALLAAEGLGGLAIRDAETEADLRRIVAEGRAAPGPVLWCGSGGLGRALAEAAPTRTETRLRAPVIGLFGSDQAATRRQLAACGALWLRLPEGAGLPAAGDAVLVSLDLPVALPRDEAARRIARGFAALLRDMRAPGTLVAAGGETLAAICATLGAEALEATGLVAPGVPRSVLRGGRWDGVEVVSKSGAFGGDALWRDLLASNGFITDRLSA